MRPGGILVVDKGAFSKRNLRKAGYDGDPLEDGSLDAFRVTEIDISHLTLDAVNELGLTKKDGLRCKNFWALGYVYWMFGHNRQSTIDWLREKFSRKPEIADANIAALNAGHAFAETSETQEGFHGYSIPQAKGISPGLHRTVTGGQALAWGLATGANRAGLKLVFCSYPITPASPVLHTLSNMANHNVTTFQAEDEIAAACGAIGASYAGSLGVTSSSGPGVALKMEAIGLAVSTELPLVVVNSQRAGPSTGLPTKTEQSDLLQAVYGRNGESPVAVLAARSPSDCFDAAVEAIRIALKYMTPVILLSDGYIGNASEPWLIPDVDDMPRIPVGFAMSADDFHPYQRDAETLSRPWAVPGTPGLEHRIGGIEKDYSTGHISYDPDNHQRMTETRAAKVAGIADDIPEQGIEAGPDRGRLAVVGWGSTYGPISRAVADMHDDEYGVSHIHLRYLWPLPRNLGDLLKRFDKVVVPEMNMGQLTTLLRSQLLIDAKGLTKTSGQPFKI